MNEEFAPSDYWRAVILYGLNTATYKIALGKCLIQFVQSGKTEVGMTDLAAAFFDLYRDRLVTGKPQLVNVDRQTVMERVVLLYNLGKVTRTQAIEMVEQQAFTDVIPRFHTLGRSPLPVQFYEHGPSGIVITDEAYSALGSDNQSAFGEELDARWGLLEAAFEIRREQGGEIVNDIREIYLAKGYERTSITHNEPVLNGYQKNMCFYCGELMLANDRHVDHVIPRKLIYHDEVWNLVLAHSFCNLQKSDALPGDEYVKKLIARNEHFIESNHPIKDKLIAQMGISSTLRADFIWNVYDHARTVVRYTWEGIRGYNPATDRFYHSVIRKLGR